LGSNLSKWVNNICHSNSKVSTSCPEGGEATGKEGDEGMQGRRESKDGKREMKNGREGEEGGLNFV
jgi:hypothetical protein